MYTDCTQCSNFIFYLYVFMTEWQPCAVFLVLKIAHSILFKKQLRFVYIVEHSCAQYKEEDVVVLIPQLWCWPYCTVLVIVLVLLMLLSDLVYAWLCNNSF